MLIYQGYYGFYDTIEHRFWQPIILDSRRLARRLPVGGRERGPGCYPEPIRGVYPERSEWAQDDSHSLQMSIWTGEKDMEAIRKMETIARHLTTL